MPQFVGYGVDARFGGAGLETIAPERDPSTSELPLEQRYLRAARPLDQRVALVQRVLRGGER